MSKELSSAEKAICGDSELIALDNEMAEVYKRALAISRTIKNSLLPAEQRGWVKGRNECWKEEDLQGCIVKTYNRRIAELQTTYRLISPVRSQSYVCDQNPAHELILHFYSTRLKSVVAEHGDDTFVLYGEPDNASLTYQGRNETLITNDTSNSVEFVPAYEAAHLTCIPREPSPKTTMHPSWDIDQDHINDCEKEGICDHTVDYSQPRMPSAEVK